MQGEIFGPPPMPLPSGIGIDMTGIHGLFFALQPDEDVWPDFSRSTDALFDQLGLEGDKQDLDRLHLTVALPGSHVRRRTSYLDAVLRSLQAFRSPAVDIVLDRAMLLGAGDRALALVGNAETQRAIARLRSDLADAQAREGVRATRAKPGAHVTIGFVQPVPGLPIDVPPVRFTARRVALVATYPGRHLHRVVESWPLDA